jgi:hypothetical protein
MRTAPAKGRSRQTASFSTLSGKVAAIYGNAERNVGDISVKFIPARGNSLSFGVEDEGRYGGSLSAEMRRADPGRRFGGSIRAADAIALTMS